MSGQHRSPQGKDSIRTPDAALIAICDEITDINQQAEALDDVDEANLARWEDLSARAATIPAESLEGLRARLRAIGPGNLTEQVPGATVGELRAQLIAAADELCRFAVGHMPGGDFTRLGGNPDTDLIAACDRYVETERQIVQIFEELAGGPDETDEAGRSDPLRRQLDLLLDRIGEQRATTVAGGYAIARALRSSNPNRELSFDWPDSHQERLIKLLFEALAAVEAEQIDTPTPKSPDAELIALCSKASELERQVFFSGDPRDVGTDDPRLIKQKSLLERSVVLRATTLAGLRAKAAMLALWDSDLLAPHESDEEYWNTHMLRSLLCDLLGAPDVNRAAGLELQERLRVGRLTDRGWP